MRPGSTTETVGVVDEVRERGGDLAHRRGIALARSDGVVHADDGEAPSGEHAQVVGDVTLGARDERRRRAPTRWWAGRPVGPGGETSSRPSGSATAYASSMTSTRSVGACSASACARPGGRRGSKTARIASAEGHGESRTAAPAATTAPTAAAPTPTDPVDDGAAAGPLRRLAHGAESTRSTTRTRPPHGGHLTRRARVVKVSKRLVSALPSMGKGATHGRHRRRHRGCPGDRPRHRDPPGA